MLNIYVGLLFVILMNSCAPTNEYKATKFDPKKPDFTFLNEVLKGKKIVALGESSHGYGDLQSYKGEMIKYLHSALGYEVFMMETGYADAKLTWEIIDLAEGGERLRNSSLFKNFMSEEMTPLFDYIKEKSETEKPLIYSGYDSQLSGKAFEFTLKNILSAIEIKVIQDSITTGLRSFHDMHRLKDSLEGWQFWKDKYIAGLDLALDVLEDNKEEILEKEYSTQAKLDILNYQLRGLKESADYNFGETYTVGLAKRDSLMALNIISQIETEYKDKKVVLWGHNGHIENMAGEGDNIKWMGHFLKEKYGNSYYALGMYCKKGSVYTHWNKTNKPFNIKDEAFIEKKLSDEYQGGVFVNLPDYTADDKWYNHQVFGFEPEAGGKISFVPTKRFDGVLLLPESKVPTFITKSSR